MKTYEYNGIEYIYPTVTILSDNGIGQSEYAARQCYNSFDKSENNEIKKLKEETFSKDGVTKETINSLQNVENSNLLEQLSFVHFHESTLEHSVISYLLTDFSRGVLQELARHRIASYSVMSTRYTLSNVINVFTACLLLKQDSSVFIKEILKYDMFVTPDKEYQIITLEGIFNKLLYQLRKIGKDSYMEISTAKSVREILSTKPELTDFNEVLEILNSKDKRNVGDSFKHIIDDNFKVNAVMTINLRSLKNFLSLRDSGAAYFQIDKLAKEMKRVTPDKYLRLIIKNFDK